MQVLVTGGAGYIGSVIAARLLARGHAVTVYDDLSRGHRAAVPAGASLVQGDIRDQSRVQGALLDSRCDAIVHMAALAEVGESVEQPERYHDVNVNGTAAVIAAAKAAAGGRLVFSSTAAVYGEPRRVPIDEDDELAPTNPYGASKLAGVPRLFEQAFAGDLAFTALRYFNACGAAGPVGAALRVFGDDYPTPDGTCVRDYVHVADLSDAHILALEALPAVQGPFNLGTGQGDSVKRVLDAVSRITGLELRREMAGRRAGDPPALVASGGRAAARLSWRPRRSLEDAVRDAWTWMQAHPRGYED